MNKQMKALKLKDVIDNSAVDASLIRGVVQWHGGWNAFKDIAGDIAQYGANTGISFVWYTDTTKFFRNHAPAIKEWLEHFTCELGEHSVGHLVQNFGLRAYNVEEIFKVIYTGKGDGLESIHQQIVFAVVEEIAHKVINTSEQLED